MLGKISNVLVQLTTALKHREPCVEVLNSSLIREVLGKLVEQGYLYGFSSTKGGTRLLLDLKYYNSKPAIKGIYMVSRPTQRICVSHRQLKLSYRTGYVLLLTKTGVITRLEALSARQGGQVLCQVW